MSSSEEIVYQVLWVEDQPERLESLKLTARDHNIKLVSVRSAQEAAKRIQTSLSEYSAVLLDARFVEEESMNSGLADVKGLRKITQLLDKNPRIQYFIYTGQKDLFDSEVFNQSYSSHRIYKKGSSQEEDELFADIRFACETHPDTQIKMKYPRVFEACTFEYLDPSVEEQLLYAIKQIEGKDNVKALNSLRDLMDDLFIAFAYHELLPYSLTTPIVQLTACSKFLTGKNKKNNEYFTDSGYKHLDETHIPSYISDQIRHILDVVQPGSHRTALDSHITGSPVSYLQQGILFQIFDLFLWFKKYIDSDPPRNNWKEIGTTNTPEESSTQEGIYGKVINMDTEKGFAFFKPEGDGCNVYIPPNLVADSALRDGMAIKIEVEEYTDKKKGEIKTRAKRIEKLQL